MISYPTIYTDARGTENTVINNDGETLQIWLRGVEFIGGSFDALTPSEEATPEQLEQFSICLDWLCSYRIEFQMPIAIQDHQLQASGQLAIEFAVGYHTSEYVPRNADDPSGIKISLVYEGGIYSNSKEDLCFENSLLRIQKQLPDGVFIKSCITCLYSDYSPYGNGMFGSMMCFRNIKAEYIKVKSKKDFWSVYKREDRWVQETYLCSEFERRIPGTGYRG